MDGVRLEQMSKFKYLGCVLNESGTDVAECCRKVARGKKVASAITSLVDASGLHEALRVPVLL